MSLNEKTNGWGEWSKYVLKELERLNDCYGEMNEEMVKIRVEIAELKMKAGVWGAVAGAIPVVVGAFIYMLKVHMEK